jgi:hypothetical protein
MSVPTANFPPNPRPVDPFDGVIETVEKITEEYVESGREDINQLMDLVETAVPFDRDPDCWCYTLAERAFCRLTGIEFDENGEPDWVKREMLPGPRRRFSIDRAKPPYIISTQRQAPELWTLVSSRHGQPRSGRIRHGQDGASEPST